MKLHLPLKLYKALLLAVAGVVTFTQDAYAGVMHEAISFQTYADFGQNKGRYVVGTQVNALLNYIRTNVDNGIKISYETNQTPFTIPNEQGMIDFRGVFENGALAAISPTFTATCKHNGSNNASYGVRTVGAANAIKYQTIDIRGSNTFRLFPENNWDYMLQRQSKVQTDATWNPIFTPYDTDGDGKVSAGESEAAVSALHGGHVYHAGAGEHRLYTGSGIKGLTGPYQYIIGDINKIHTASTQTDKSNNITVAHGGDYAGDGYLDKNPLPNALIPGDSGSPSFVYNATTKRYEYIGAQNSGNFLNSANVRGNVVWTHETLNSFNKQVDMSKGTVDGDSSTVYLNAIGVEQEGEVKKDNLGNTGTIYTGKVTNESGKVLATYRGIKNGEHTWKDLSAEKDKENWYAYSTYAVTENGETVQKSYLQQTDTDLFFNDNLVFTANSATEINNVVLKADVDLGVGYVEFNAGKYTISAQGDYQLDSAGYVLNKNSEVHLNLTNDTKRMTEWRATGPGTLYLEGSKDNNVLLNVGGESTIYLQQKDGYAAYNVLVNTGAKVVIKDVDQIKRDFTFGAGGGELDLNGNDHTWNDSDTDGFTIHALTEEALISNRSETTKVTLNVETSQGVYKGSFAGNMDVVYEGSGDWKLHSIHTELNEGCGITVESGSVSLSGTNTEHGMGSATGTNKNRLDNKLDWHYADATMVVTVKNGSTFELGSHARLTGDVTVESGTFIMREGVQHDHEYVEGGADLEAVSAYKDFYGLKGNVSLADGAQMQIKYNDGVTAHNEYASNITGSGDVSVELGTSGAKLTLSGTNTFSGSKTLSSGTVIAGSHAALGDCQTNKWKIGDAGVLSMTGVTQESVQSWQSYVASDSTGVLALSENQTTQLELSNHQKLIIGALAGKTVTYGNDDETLTAHNDGWVLGGGGGTLVVESLLTDDKDADGNVVTKHNLVLGNQYGTGTVKLNNLANDFSGTITVNGKMTLDYAVKTDESGNFISGLGKAVIAQEYGNRAYGHDGTANFAEDCGGVLLVDRMGSNEQIDLTKHENLYIGAASIKDFQLNANLIVAKGQAYKFGGTTTTLFVNSKLEAGHDVIVDGQGYSDGLVKLNNSGNEITGNVTIMGNNGTQSTGGYAILYTEIDNMLNNAQSVTIKDGGELQFNDAQTIQLLTMDAGSYLVGNGMLTVKEGESKGALQVFGVTKESSSHVGLLGAGFIGYVFANEGSMEVKGDYVINALYLASGNQKANLKIGGNTYVSSLDLSKNGTLTCEGSSYSISTLSINEGATFNINNVNSGGNATADGIGQRITTVKLAGGSLVNQGDGVADTKRQFYNIALTANSTIDSTARFGLIGANYAATSLDLAGKTLTKSGVGIFDLNNTTISDGTINVTAGELLFTDRGNQSFDSTIAADIALTGKGASFNIDKTGTGVVALAGDSTEVSSMNIKKGSVVLAGAQASVDSVSVNGGKLQLGSYTTAVDANDKSTTVTFTNGVIIEGKDGKEGTITGEITTKTELGDTSVTVTLAGTSGDNKAIISNALIDVMAGCTLNLSHVELLDTTRITDDPATLSLDDVVAHVTANNSSTADAVTEQMELTMMDGGTTRTVEAGAQVLNITSSLMDTVTVTDGSMVIALGDGINLAGYDYVSLTFTDGEHAASFSTDMSVTLLYEGQEYDVYYRSSDAITAAETGEEGTTTTTFYAAVPVPEPTTATLSLLALAALAARRRRR